MTSVDLLLAGLAAVVAGAINALAGGGTLLSFPVLVALGMPAVSANITNAVALCPGYFGAAIAQMRNLQGQRARVLFLVPVSALGGLVGGLILLRTGEGTFTALIPWMIFAASLLLAVQKPLHAAVLRRIDDPQRKGHHVALTALPIAAASIYGGFFSAGMSVLLLAVVGLVLDDTFTRLNALKQVLSFSVNVASAAFFVASGRVIWSVAVVMAIGSLLGGALGGRLAGRMKPAILRWTIVAMGTAIAIAYWVR
jgi:uncharacterized protein